MHSASRSTILSLLTLLAAACGSESQKAAAPPAYDLNGDWSVAATGVQKTCSDDPTIPAVISITHDGTSNQFTIGASALSSTPITGTIDGSTVTFSTSQNITVCTPLAVNAHITLSDADHGTGTATYLCSYSGGSCGGTMNLTITRL